MIYKAVIERNQLVSFTAECDNETMIKVAENIKVIEVEDED